jgi:hypothetical protein
VIIWRSPRNVFWGHHLAEQLCSSAMDGIFGLELGDAFARRGQLGVLGAGRAR